MSSSFSISSAQVPPELNIKKSVPSTPSVNFIVPTNVGRLANLADARLILLGDSNHYGAESKIVSELALETLVEMQKSNHRKRKCLAPEAEPILDPLFRNLSKSSTPESKDVANIQLEKMGLGPVTIGWIGNVYTMPFFEFAQAHGWIVRSGDMHRNEEYWQKSRAENVDPQWLRYHQLYLRDQFMTQRLRQLLVKDCDLVVFFVGSAHLMQTEEIPEFKVSLRPIPILLRRENVKSLNIVFLADRQTESWTSADPASLEQQSVLSLIDAFVTK